MTQKSFPHRIIATKCPSEWVCVIFCCLAETRKQTKNNPKFTDASYRQHDKEYLQNFPLFVIPRKRGICMRYFTAFSMTKNRDYTFAVGQNEQKKVGQSGTANPP